MRKILLLFTLCVFATLNGCKSDDDPKDRVEMSLLSAGEFVNTGKKYEILVKSNTSWELALPVEWGTLDPSSGTGDKTCYLTLYENFGTDRTATITAKAGIAKNEFTFTQKGAKVTAISKSKIEFNSSGDPTELSISSQSSWEIENSEDASWVIFSKTKGTQGETITLTPTKQTERYPRGPVNIRIRVGTETKVLVLSQEAENSAPGTFSLTPFGDAKIKYTDNIVFNWSPSVDPDDDAVKYDVMISKNNINWETLVTGISVTSYEMPDDKLGWDQYYWKVVAKDVFNATAETSVSLLKIDYMHYDDMVYVLKENAVPGCNPINLVVIGDGYLSSDYNCNGTFNKHLETTMDVLFRTEPYKTYKDYFKVTVIVAYSAEQGVTILEDFSSGAKMKKQTKNSRFKSECAGGNSTIINSPSTEIRAYINNQLGLATGVDNSWAVVMLINVDAWAGSCTTWTTGYSIAKSAADYNLGKRMVHEAGGHGFAKLADEYINNSGMTLPESDKNTLINNRKGDPWIYRANVDITGSMDEVHWKHYFTIPGYQQVGLYQGCWLYSYGAWRAEDKSIMQGSSANAGFNAPSREAIVRRIMLLSGQTFDFDDFLAKDKPDFVSTTRSPYYVDPNIKEAPPEELDDFGRPIK